MFLRGIGLFCSRNLYITDNVCPAEMQESTGAVFVISEVIGTAWHQQFSETETWSGAKEFII